MAAIQSLTLSALRSLWSLFDSSKRRESEHREPTNPSSSIDLKKLAAPSDLSYLPTIRYAYNPLPALNLRLKHPPLLLTSGATSVNPCSSRNSIRLDPSTAGLPYCSSIDHVYASKYWKINLDETKKTLQLLAEDDSASDIEVDHGITLSQLAKRALRPGHEDQIALATHFVFPSADAQRIRQIAALTVVYLVFDGRYSTKN